jgi:hypothetical protein
MFMKFHHIYLSLLIALFAPGWIFAQDVQSRVNTLPSSKVLPPPTSSEIKRGAVAIKIPRELKVPPEWIPLLNRAYEEYWMEGNHRPDAGFVLFARNPSKETAKLWLLRMESKAQNLEELFGYVKAAQQELVSTGLMVDRFNMVNKASIKPMGSSNNSEKITENSAVKSGFSDLQFYFLFSPTCAHCARMAQNLVGFPNVHPLQVTGGELHNWPGLPESDHATPETIESYVKDGQQPSGVPVLAIYQPKTNRVLKLRGSRTTQEILAAAAAVQNGQKAKWPFLGPIHPSKISQETSGK